MSDDINYTKEAFLAAWNLAFVLVAAVVATGTTLTPLAPAWAFEVLLAVSGGLELLYLGTVPRSDRFRRLVRARKEAERRTPPAQRDLYRRLSRRSQRRYYRLRELKTEIRANYRQLRSVSQGLLNTHLQKIDDLLRSYLQLLHQRERYWDLATHTSEAEVRRAIRALKDDMADDAERVRTVKQRRLSVLEKRRARFEKAHENLEIIGAQLGTIEDVVKYIHEQSWTLQNPEAVTTQLNALMEEVDATQQSIHEIEGLFSGSTEALDDDLDALDEELKAATGRPLDPVEEESPSGESSSSPSRSRVRD
jgi:hypothetical protein